ncbi:TetR/AcrR family transcriptional regulator [Curtobacterium sp. MCBD17_023]|uniref:TetR/AcrR family transcriptional regulator n=1 Tax=Curtobacterium sp. MCBD17_023 TaxID=2175657 RepID=UPI000D8F96C0|nr:TetR/AcrR family transcriptional regulator [Curtobacterium sp. MCBD17_023]PYY46223.1 TetR/AcrR family transcriptional regulator [Curtobacterium sp. MCBD17_023]
MTPPSLIAPAPHRTSVQDAIVVSADALFTAEGITPVALDRVAVGAQVTPAELREAFPTRQALVVAALQYRHDEWMTALITAEASFEDPRDQILAVFSHLEDCFTDHSYRGCAFINGYGELGRLNPVVAGLAHEHLRQLEQHIAILCAAAEMPAHLAPALTLLIQGAQVEAAIHGNITPARTGRMAAAMLMSVYEAPSLF